MAAAAILNPPNIAIPQLSYPTFSAGSPDAIPIRIIHRGADGYVTLHRKAREGEEDLWVAVGAVELPNLISTFPELSAELRENSYFSINSTYRAAPWKIARTGLPYPARKALDFRWLNACYADLDCCRIGHSADAALASIAAMIDRGELAQPSILVHSGRGIWLLWLLVDEKDRSMPQRAWPEKIELYCRVQRAIVQRLAAFGADPACVDVSRVMRVPASLNKKAPVGLQRVRFQQVVGGDGQRAAYTLAELAVAFGIHPKKTTVTPAQWPTGCSASSRRPSGARNRCANAGSRVRWQNALADFETLRQLRGGFKKGCRTYAVLLYSYLLMRNGVPNQQIQAAALELAAECQPSLMREKALRTMEDGCSRLTWPIRHSTVARMLLVTDEEREHLKYWFPMPKLSCRERIAHRHGLIVQLVRQLGFIPSQRKMSRLLKDNGCSVTTRQVSRDYHDLQLDNYYHHRYSPPSLSTLAH